MPELPDVAVQCPHCGAPMLHHEPVDEPEATPTAGDVAMCWVCGHPSIFDTGPDGHLRTRKPTAEELADIDADPRVRATRLARVLSADPWTATDTVRRVLARFAAATEEAGR